MIDYKITSISTVTLSILRSEFFLMQTHIYTASWKRMTDP